MFVAELRNLRVGDLMIVKYFLKIVYKITLITFQLLNLELVQYLFTKNLLNIFCQVSRTYRMFDMLHDWNKQTFFRIPRLSRLCCGPQAQWKLLSEALTEESIFSQLFLNNSIHSFLVTELGRLKFTILVHRRIFHTL